MGRDGVVCGDNRQAGQAILHRKVHQATPATVHQAFVPPAASRPNPLPTPAARPSARSSLVVHQVYGHIERLPVQQAVHPVEPGVVEVVQRHYGGYPVGGLQRSTAQRSGAY